MTVFWVLLLTSLYLDGPKCPRADKHNNGRAFYSLILKKSIKFNSYRRYTTWYWHDYHPSHATTPVVMLKQCQIAKWKRRVILPTPCARKKETEQTKGKMCTNKTCRGISCGRMGDARKHKKFTNLPVKTRRKKSSRSAQDYYWSSRLRCEPSRRLSISLLARFRPSPIFLVRRQSWPIRCMRTAATTIETADRNLLRGVRAGLRSPAWTPISEIMRRSASLLECFDSC